MFNDTLFGWPAPGQPDDCLEIDSPQSVLGLFFLFSFFLSHFFLGLRAPSWSSSGSSWTLLNPSSALSRENSLFISSFSFISFPFLVFIPFFRAPLGPSQTHPRALPGALLGCLVPPLGWSRAPLGPVPHNKLTGLTPSHRP
jgi:hypothetical protein